MFDIFKYLSFLENIIFYEIFGFPLIIILILSASLFFSFYLSFPANKLLKISFKNLLKNDTKEDSIINSKQSIITSLSSILGLGSIAGTATGIYMGGAGSIFWLIVITIFGMNLSFSETLLSIKYKNQNIKEKSVECAPIRYIRESLKDINFVKLGIFLSFLYGFLYFTGLLAMIMYEVKEATNIITKIDIFNKKDLFVTTFIEILVILASYKGISGISKILEKTTSFIIISYLFLILLVILFNIKNLPLTVYKIIIEAFSFKSVTGGIIVALSTGVRRGIFSTEIGLGSATTPYAAIDTNDKILQATKASLNPLLITIISVLTGIAIISSGVYKPGNSLNGIVLVNEALATVSPFFTILLAIIIFLLVLNITITVTYNSQNIYNYCFGRRTTIVFILLHILITVLTVYLDLNKIINIGDSFYLSIGIPNIICLFLARKIIKNIYKNNL